MPWFLLDLRVMLAAALVAMGLYAAVQRIEKEQAKAELVQFKADVESEAAKAKVRNAQEALRQAQASEEVVSDLQTRNAALSRAYASLRRTNPGSGGVPTLPQAPPSPGACPGSPQQPDPSIGCLQAIQFGDEQLAKYAELWRLQEKNAR